MHVSFKAKSVCSVTSMPCGLCTGKQAKHDGNLSFQVWLLKNKNVCDLVFSCLWSRWTRQGILHFSCYSNPPHGKPELWPFVTLFLRLYVRERKGDQRKLKGDKMMSQMTKTLKKFKPSNSPWITQVSGSLDSCREPNSIPYHRVKHYWLLLL